MNDTKKSSRLFMILNCLTLGIIAMNLTAPVHEATHLLTQMILQLYGQVAMRMLLQSTMD